jgi:hypothetical protein
MSGFPDEALIAFVGRMVHLNGLPATTSVNSGRSEERFLTAA